MLVCVLGELLFFIVYRFLMKLVGDFGSGSGFQCSWFGEVGCVLKLQCSCDCVNGVNLLWVIVGWIWYSQLW